jgi:hypothetical protein
MILLAQSCESFALKSLASPKRADKSFNLNGRFHTPLEQPFEVSRPIFSVTMLK